MKAVLKPQALVSKCQSYCKFREFRKGVIFAKLLATFYSYTFIKITLQNFFKLLEYFFVLRSFLR